MQGNLEASSLDVLSSALDLARVGLARWDTDDRLIAYNNTYRSLVYHNQQERCGCRKLSNWPGLLRQADNAPPGQTTEGMVAARMKRHAARSNSFEYHSNKRWFRVAERRTPDGGAVGVYIDVTEERRNELMARESERRLRLLFDNMRNIAYCLGTRGASGFGYDHDGVKVYGRDAPEMFGTISKDGYADVEAWYNAVHPDDRERHCRRTGTPGARRRHDLALASSIPSRRNAVGARSGVDQRRSRTPTGPIESYIIDITDEKSARSSWRASRRACGSRSTKPTMPTWRNRGSSRI
jgi:PAS domain-containing protein